MIRLFIEEQEIELPSSVTIALSKKVADIGDFKSRFASFTNRFQIPLNRNNRAALGLLQYNTSSQVPYQITKGKLVSDGVGLTANARLVINQASDTAEVELKVLSGNIFDLLKKTKLRSLDLSAYKHRWNQTNIIAAKTNGWEDCYVYALMQLGLQSETTPVAGCKGLIPHVYAKFLLQQCAARFGYNMAGVGYDTDEINNVTLPIQRLFNNDDILSDYQGTGGASRVLWDGTSLDAITIQGISGWAVDPIEFVPDVWGVTNDAQGVTFGGSPVKGFEMLLKGTYTVRIDYTFTLYDFAPSGQGGVAILRRTGFASIGGLSSFTIVTFVQQNIEGTFTGSVTVTVTQDQINDNRLHEFDYLYLGAFMTGNGKIDYDYTMTVVSVNAEQTYFNRPLTLAPNLPDWDMGKLFKEVANFVGAYYDVDEFSQTIYMNTLTELSANKVRPEDWSEKLVVSPPPVRRFQLSGFGKTTSLRYNDSNLYRYDFTIANEQLNDTADYINSAFNSVIQQRVCNIDNVAAWEAWEGNLDNSGRAKLDNKPRLCLIRLEPAFQYSAPNQSTPASSGNSAVAYIVNAGDLSLSWPDLYAKYYADILDDLTDYILVITGQFHLNNLDVSKLDFRVPIWIKSYGMLFYVNEVKEFSGANQLTEVELVRIS